MSTTPSFVDVPTRLAPQQERWRRFMRDTLCMLRVSLVCRVVSFNEDDQTVTVQPVIREKININLVPTDTDMIQLSKVPVLLPGGGNFVVTFPIQPGDECLVIFHDNCMNSWWQNGSNANQNQEDPDLRRHDLSDGFALFGPNSLPNVISNYSTNAIQLRTLDGTVVVEIGDNEVTIKAPNVTVVPGTLATIQGNAKITGNLEVDGTLTVDSKNLGPSHRHSGVSTGSGDTGAVV